ncbi:PAS domain-containing protein [Pelagibius sp. Alg239-R121]|uniref:PAS domain-containing protein n=1 Tax=Pelagibius sp. Alg239-R121 TaxID=2993448 RepID=UPI0024A729FC|nr:PAS domain-containing protein [Pelagibius sp. Alg239-R121]
MSDKNGDEQRAKNGPRYTTSRALLANCPEQIADLFRYWDKQRGDRLMPQRGDIRPEDFVAHLPGILLVDVEGTNPEGLGNFRYRVVGTDEVWLRGFDPTGKRVEDGFFGPSLEDVVETYEFVRRERTFIYDPLEYETPNGRWRNESTIFLPLSEDGESVSQILVYSIKRDTKFQLT